MISEDLVKEYVQSILDEIKLDTTLTNEKEIELLELGSYFVPIMVDQVEVGKAKCKTTEELVQYLMDMMTRTFLESNL